jgi:hypothetical protein
MLKFFLFLTPIVFLFLSCNKNNPDPSWIEIKEWELISNKTNKEGELSHNFKNAYIEIDDETIGFFELPIRLPILKTGEHVIKISPVVLNNGISASKTTYSFCETYKTTINLTQNSTVTISPKTSYLKDCIFWIEDFEDAGIKLKSEESFSNFLSISNNPKYLKYGNNYAQIKVNKEHPIWQGITSMNSSLPQGRNIYLELDYLNTCPLLTGVYVSNSTENKYYPNVTLNAQSNSNLIWKKVYIDLRQMVSYSQNGSFFEQYFNVNNSSNSLDSNFVLIDNLKIIYR